MAPSAAPLVYSSASPSRSPPPHRASASRRPVGDAAAPLASSVHLAEEGEIHTLCFSFASRHCFPSKQWCVKLKTQKAASPNLIRVRRERGK